MATPRQRGQARARVFRRSWGNTEQPLPDLFDEIYSRTGIFVLRKKLSVDVDGGLFTLGAKRAMVINTHGRHLAKQRATAAHELGHFDEKADADFAEVIREGAQSEAFAEGFAVEMLLPETGVREWVTANASGEAGTRPGHVSQLAAYFGTSYEMAARQLRAIDHITSAELGELLALPSGGRAAAFEGGVIAWYDQNVAGIDLNLELPRAYLVRARTAYAESLLTLDRLAELEFRSVEAVRADLKREGLLHAEDEEGATRPREKSPPASPSGATTTSLDEGWNLA